MTTRVPSRTSDRPPISHPIAPATRTRESYGRDGRTKSDGPLGLPCYRPHRTRAYDQIDAMPAPTPTRH